LNARLHASADSTALFLNFTDFYHQPHPLTKALQVSFFNAYPAKNANTASQWP